MTKNLLATFALAIVSATSFNAQNFIRCTSYERDQIALANDPGLHAIYDQQEQDYQQFLAAHPDGYNNRSIVTIPVIFHVLYNTTAQNVSTTRLLQQIDVLNKDYRKNNTDANLVPSAWAGLAADCEIEFCLAKQDPFGGWTDGIERLSTSTTVFDWQTDDMKFFSMGGADAWDRTRYLNIWVCNINGGVLGFATLPGGNASVDGVVLLYQAVGITGAVAPYNKGRTATHEIGHWLNLRHVWGDDGSSCSGSDQVSDTPNQGSENYGCPTFPNTDNCATSSPGVMSMNYMDYTDDACMYFFTTGQKTRMWAALNGSRLSIQTSNVCTPVGISPNLFEYAFSVHPSPSNGEFTLEFGTDPQLKNVDINVTNTLGQTVYTRHFDALNEDRMQLDLTGNLPGIYILEVRTSNERVIRKIVIE
jgi:hypothetical protein